MYDNVEGYEIIGESVKSATSIKLGAIFGTDIKRYKEEIQNPENVQYPNFFIYQPSANITPTTRNRWNIDYLINIRYRYVEDIETVTTLQQNLDQMALNLMAQFTEIQLERPVKVKNARYEKAEGVLQFFFNVTVMIKRQLTEDEKMRILKLNEELKREEMEQEQQEESTNNNPTDIVTEPTEPVENNEEDE